MKPDSPHTQAHQQARSVRPHIPQTSENVEDSALNELSSASGRYIRATANHKPIRRRPSWMLSILFALVAGVSLFFSEQLEYPCTANFVITGAPTTYQLTFYRKELLDYAWHRLAEKSPSSAPNPLWTLSWNQSADRPWFVDAPQEGKLRLCLTTTNRELGMERITNLADGYLSQMESLRKQTLSTPSEGEKILGEYMSILQRRLIAAQSQADTLMAKLPANDPGQDLDTLREKWKRLYTDFKQTKERLTDAIQELDQLRMEPEPAVGVVSAQQRKEVLQANDALQQDLQELKVNLSELKLYLLDIWQPSSGPLEKLTSAVQTLHTLVTDTQSRTLTEDVRGQFELLTEQVRLYQEKLLPFVQIWNKEFAAVRQTEIDPYNDNLLSTYHRIRSTVNDFLFSAARHLSDMRMLVTHIGESQSDQARYYVLQSELVSSFQNVQSAHHRFEFAAGGMDTSTNFRLDTALKSAKGLYRRTQQQIEIVDRHLRTQALEQARKQRQEKMIAASRMVDEVRSSSDRTIENLVQIQSDLNLTTDEAEAFQKLLFEAELATSRLQSLQGHLGEVNRRLQDVEDEHAASVDASHIELQTCYVDERPTNLFERLRIGGLGAILTMFTVFMAQWWVGRRR